LFGSSRRRALERTPASLPHATARTHTDPRTALGSPRPACDTTTMARTRTLDGRHGHGPAHAPSPRTHGLASPLPWAARGHGHTHERYRSASPAHRPNHTNLGQATLSEHAVARAHHGGCDRPLPLERPGRAARTRTDTRHCHFTLAARTRPLEQARCPPPRENGQGTAFLACRSSHHAIRMPAPPCCALCQGYRTGLGTPTVVRERHGNSAAMTNHRPHFVKP
jgi:hypothetical protein